MKFSLYKTRVLFFFLIVSLILPSFSAQADVFLEAKLVVNILPGNTQTNEQIYDILEEANRILGQCGHISFTLAESDIKRPGAFPGGFDHDEENEILTDRITDAEHLTGAHGEIEHGGYKIFLAHSVKHDDGRNTNGSTFTGKHVSELRERDGINGDGRTWAHELAHGLGLGHNGNPDNLMSPRRRADGTPGGTSLTEDQCETIRRNFFSLSPLVEVTVDQQGVVPGDRTATTVLVGSNTIVGDFHFIDAARFIFYRSSSLNTLDTKLFLGGLLPRNRKITARYSIFLNTDNNPTTGISLGAQRGIDKTITIDVGGLFPFAAPGDVFSATLTDTVSNASSILERPSLFTHEKLTDTGSISALSDDAILLTIPLAGLGMIGDNVGVSFETLVAGVISASKEFFVPTNIAKPSVHADVLRVRAGKRVNLSGSGFASNSDIKFFWDNNFKNTVEMAQTDANGSFAAILVIPAHKAGNHILDAIDANGTADIVVFTVEEQQKNLAVVILRILLVLVVGIIFVLFFRKKNALVKK